MAGHLTLNQDHPKGQDARAHEPHTVFDVRRLIGAGFNFATVEDYNLAFEWAERAYIAGRKHEADVTDYPSVVG